MHVHKVCLCAWQADKDEQQAQRHLLQDITKIVKEFQYEQAARQEQRLAEDSFYGEVIVSCYTSHEAAVLFVI